jgi:hypothetical protein
VSIQQIAELEIGTDPDYLTDYTCEVSEFVILKARLTSDVTTFATDDTRVQLLKPSLQVRITFLATFHASEGLWWELNEAADSESGELYFSVIYDAGTVSAGNPKFTGIIQVAGLEIGAPAYTTRRQSQVFPAHSVLGPLSSE